MGGSVVCGSATEGGSEEQCNCHVLEVEYLRSHLLALVILKVLVGLSPKAIVMPLTLYQLFKR